jgi:hypothetical protein
MLINPLFCIMLGLRVCVYVTTRETPALDEISCYKAHPQLIPISISSRRKAEVESIH